MQQQTVNGGRSNRALSRGLAACALVGAGAMLGVALSQPAAYAQPSQVTVIGGSSGAAPASESQGMVSAGEQRKSMLDEMRSMNSRLERIETLLSKGLSVRVTEMPAGAARPQAAASDDAGTLGE